MPTFGETNQGTSYNSVENSIQGTVFTCPENGFATGITARIDWIPNPDFKVRCGLYSYPDLALLGETVELVGPIAGGWIEFAFPTAIPLTAGSQYLLVAHGSQGSTLYFFVDYSATTYGYSQPYGSLPTSLTGAGLISLRFSIFCTYQATAPPTQYTLAIAQSTGGTTNPVAGAYLYNVNTVVSVQAIADAGYTFDHWEQDGANAGSVNPIPITMNFDHTLLAVFAEIPSVLKHTLIVGSTPIEGVPFTIEKVS